MKHVYRLPRTIAARLDAAIEGRRNAAAVRLLAVWLGRMWSAPRRLLYAFPIDRRAIANRDDLGLSEARVRGALAVLEEIGFLARYEPSPGKRYQRTEEGLHRRPILFRFGEEYVPSFAKANARAEAARGAPAARRPAATPQPLPMAAQTRPHPPFEATARPPAQLAQKQTLGGSLMIMGDQEKAEPSSPLEAALARWARAALA